MSDLVLRIKVIPKSAKSEVVGTMEDGTVKIRIAAVAEKGKANAELIAFLAKQYNVSRGDVKIMTGETSALKQVRIRGGLISGRR